MVPIAGAAPATVTGYISAATTGAMRWEGADRWSNRQPGDRPHGQISATFGEEGPGVVVPGRIVGLRRLCGTHPSRRAPMEPRCPDTLS